MLARAVAKPITTFTFFMKEESQNEHPMRLLQAKPKRTKTKQDIHSLYQSSAMKMKLSIFTSFAIFSSAVVTVNAFVPVSRGAVLTRLHLEDHIADM